MEDLKNFSLTMKKNNCILWIEKEYCNNKHDCFEVGNGSRRTLKRVPEMLDTPPIRNDYAFFNEIKNKETGMSRKILYFFHTHVTISSKHFSISF